jgi:hypothetical protein
MANFWLNFLQIIDYQHILRKRILLKLSEVREKYSKMA